MKHVVQKLIRADSKTHTNADRDVASSRVRQGTGRVEEFFRTAGPETGFTDYVGLGTINESLQLVDASHDQFRNEIVDCLAPVISKRKYEDMTSSSYRRDDEIEPEIDHESFSSKVNNNFSRESKRRKPPEAAGDSVFMHVQVKVQDQGHRGVKVDECPIARGYRNREGGSSPRSGSTSRVVVFTSEVCGESDLTAENLMADESSRSSNNDASSTIKYESAVESRSKASNKKPQSSSNKGVQLQPQSGSSTVSRVLHSFLQQPEGKGEINPISDSSVAAYHDQRPLAINDVDVHNLASTSTRQMEAESACAGVAKLEPVSFRPLVPPSRLSIATDHEQQQAGGTAYSTSSPPDHDHENERWLQLGVGSSRKSPISNSRFDPAAGSESSRESRDFDKKRKTPSLDFHISSEFLPQNLMMAADSVQRQALRGSIPHKVEPNVDSSASLGSPSHTFLNLPRTMGMREIGPDYNLESKDVDPYRSTFTHDQSASGAQIASAQNRGSTSLREFTTVTGNAGSAERNLQAMSSLLSTSIDNRLHMDPQGSKHPSASSGTETLIISEGVGKAGVLSRALPSFLCRPGDEVQFGSPQGVLTDHPVQFQRSTSRDNRPLSMVALMQPSEDKCQTAQNPWLSASDDAAHKLNPLAQGSNIHGWSADGNTSTRPAGISSGQLAAESRPLINQVDPQLQRVTDDWRNLYTKVSSGMLFPSQVQLPDGSSIAAVPHEGLDNTGLVNNVYHTNQNRLQTSWTSTSEATDLGQVASWCLNGLKRLGGTRGEELGNEESPVSTSVLQDRPSSQLRFQDSEQILRPKQPFQRQSWQPGAPSGQSKLQQQGNRVSRSAALSDSRQKLQVFPSLPRGTTQAGLWFLLQSAASENQLRNEENGLPQITKAYLRIKDGQMPVSTVKKYLVTKLGLTSDAEVEITCRGQPVVPSLPLQQVRDEIWYSTLEPLKYQTTLTSGSGEKGDSSFADQKLRQAGICSPAMFSKDVVMVLSYRRHRRSMPPSC